jgi:hypothetical protein
VGRGAVALPPPPNKLRLSKRNVKLKQKLIMRNDMLKIRLQKTSGAKPLSRRIICF